MRGLGVVLRVLGVVALVAGCGSTPTPAPSATATPSTAPAYADTIRVALLRLGAGFGMEFANSTRGLDDQGKFIDRFLYRALYRHDARFAPVPDLAAEPCDVASDLVTITCRLRDARFSDGDPITADDVVFTYQLAMSDVCPFEVFPYCDSHNLASVESVDARTVRFTLKEPDAPFLTTVLPGIFIESNRATSDADSKWRATAEPIGAEAMAAEADRIDALLSRDPAPADAECEELLPDADALIRRAGIEPASPALFTKAPSLDIDACDELNARKELIADMHDALGMPPTDAMAVMDRHFSEYAPRAVGSGSWMVSSFDPGKELVVEAAPGAAPATPRFVFEFMTDRREALTREMAGTMDWVAIPGFQGNSQGSADLVRFVRQDPRLQVAHFAVPGTYTVLEYNQRPGEIMADEAIREAVDRCVDKPAIVEAATDGLAAPAWSFVPPGTWAAAADLPQLPRDVTAATELIAKAGWTMGADGYYAKAGRRLALTVLVNEAATYRHRFLELASLQLRDCGFELKLEPQRQGGPGGINEALCTWPLTFPGDKRPFEAVLWSAIGDPDPWNQSDFAGRAIIGAGQDCFSGSFTNPSGYRNDEFDGLLGKVRTTYDAALRVEYFKRMQEVLANDHAALFAWFNTEYDVLSPGLATTGGAIDLTTAGWSAQLETIIKSAGP